MLGVLIKGRGAISIAAHSLVGIGMQRETTAPLLLSGLLLVLAVAESCQKIATVSGAEPTLMKKIREPTRRPEQDARKVAAVILGRPLFSLGRRPPGSLGVQHQKIDSQRLTAVLVSGETRGAIFDDHGKSIFVHEGQRAGNYIVISIHPGGLLALGPFGSRELRPLSTTGSQSAGAYSAKHGSAAKYAQATLFKTTRSEKPVDLLRQGSSPSSYTKETRLR